MYQKYQSDALVLGSREQGEADRVYVLYTADFGLVRARASAVRSESSRMRYALQHYSRATVALVKGKRGWRIAGASAHLNLDIPTVACVEAVSAFARIATLVQRLVQGQERNDYLFAALTEALETFATTKDASMVGIIEIVCVARVLYALGYISSEALSTALFTHTAYTGESLLEAESMKDKLLTSINNAIAETQL